MSVEVVCSFRDGAYVEIKGDSSELYIVEFFDKDNNILIHTHTMMSNHWTKTKRRFFTNWKVKVSTIDGKIIYEEAFQPEEKEVLIIFASNSLGDNLAWIPYCEQFRKKHKCKVTVQSILGALFEDQYPEITFLKPWVYQLNDERFYSSYIIAMGIEENIHRAGINKLNNFFSKNIPIKFIDNLSYWDKELHLEHPSLIPLQKIGSNVLGLDFSEIKPSISKINLNRPIEKKYICISEFASAEGMKMWQNQVGWKTLVTHLRSLDYEIVSISKEKSRLKNVIKRNGGYDLKDRIWYLQHCEFFIGMSSGLSWLSWFVGTPTVIISGHSKKWYEPTSVVRIINENVCHGCHNVPEHADKFCCYHTSFCPTNQNFVCTRAISPKMVIESLENNNLI